MTDTPKYVLRDLPGAADFEELWIKVQAHPNPNWAPDYDRIGPMAEALSRRWFGMIDDDIYALEDGPYERVREQLEAFESSPFSPNRKADTEPAAAIGWDITDGSDGVHPVFGYVVEALVCAALGLAGRLPDTPISDDEAKARAVDWGSSLEAEAAKFSSKPHRGRNDR